MLSVGLRDREFSIVEVAEALGDPYDAVALSCEDAVEEPLSDGIAVNVELLV